MAAVGRKQDRAARRRLREYTARQEVARTQEVRRRRDSVIAAVAVAVVLVLATTAQVLYLSVGPGAPTPTPSASPSSSADPSTPAAAVPDASISENRAWTGELVLNDGIALGLSLDGAAAPQAVANFVSLADDGFYDGLACHRLVDEDAFGVLQCGDPAGDGTGGPGYTFGPVENAPADGIYPAGTIAMARTGGDEASQGSQFFICFEDTTIDVATAGGYTVFGTVTSGLDVLRTEVVAAGAAPADASGNTAPNVPVVITSLAVS